MNKMTQVLLSVMAIFLIVGCGGSNPAARPVTAPRSGPDLEPPPTKNVLKKEPKWYKNTDAKDGWIYPKGEGTSASKSLAREKAKTALSVDLREKIANLVEARRVNFQKEIGGDFDSELFQEFSNMQVNIMNGLNERWQELNSETVVESNPKKKGESIYRCYILGQWSYSAADEKFMQELKNSKQLRTAFEASKEYEKTQADFERYKEKLGM